MPIQLNYTEPNTGLSASVSYWFLQLGIFDTVNQTVTFTLNGYLSLAAKNSGKAPFLNQTIPVSFAALGVTGASTINQIVTAAYNYALTYTDPLTGLKFFQGGVIV